MEVRRTMEAVGGRQAAKRREGGECTITVYLYTDHSDEEQQLRTKHALRHRKYLWKRTYEPPFRRR